MIVNMNAHMKTSAVLAGVFVTAYYIIFGGPVDKKMKKKKKDYIPGLTNIGNSCFLNALVQAFASCPLFINWLELKLYKSSPDLASSLHKLLKVLNNEGGHGGDACAGEVLMALRGQGWVISTDEQDTHELFHVLTATLDDELMRGEDTPSLLDVSWVEKTSLHGDQKQRKANGIMCKINFDKSCCKDNFKKYKNETESKIPKENEFAFGETHLEYPFINHPYEVNSIEDNNCSKNNTNIQIQDGRLVCNSLNNCKKQEKTYNSKISNDHLLEETHILDSNLNLSNIKISRIENENNDTNIINRNIFSKSNMNCVKEENNKNTIERRTHTRNYSTEKLFTNNKKKEENNWVAYNENSDNPFRGYLASQLQCTACFHKNPAQWSSFESISLSLPSVSWGDLTLQELLHSYITHEKVSDVTCDNCSKFYGRDAKTIFNKRLTIGKLPECLCFHIKRTVWMENGSAVKRRDHVTFSEFLVMDPFTYTTSITLQETIAQQQTNNLENTKKETPNITTKDSTILTANSDNLHLKMYPPPSIMSQNASAKTVGESSFLHVAPVKCEQLYRLKAVIVHVGDIFCGHFVTYRRGPIGTRAQNRWFYTSDILIREATLAEVLKANAYMLLYEKALYH